MRKIASAIIGLALILSASFVSAGRVHQLTVNTNLPVLQNNYVCNADAVDTIDLLCGLPLYLHFQQSAYDGTADEVVDSSGQGNNCVAVNGATTVADGKLGRALELNGTDQYLNCGNDSSLALTRWTLAAWVNRDTDSGSSERIIVKSDGASWDYFIQINSVDKVQSAFTDTGGTARFIDGQISIPITTWTFIAATFDGQFIRLYVNGELDETSTDFSAFTPRTSSKELWIGRLEFTFGFDGMIDEAVVADRAWSADEIKHFYNATRGRYIQ